MNFELDEEKRKFFENCKIIARAPACVFLEGDRFSKKAKLLPIPLYVYVGIEKGNYSAFEYEEFIRVQRNQSGYGIDVIFQGASLRRTFFYKKFLNEKYKPMLVERELIKKGVIKDECSTTDYFNKKIIKEFLPKFKKCFKLKVWSDVPRDSLNDSAAVSVAMSILLFGELMLNDEMKAKFLKTVEDIIERFREESLTNLFFNLVYKMALAFDFYSNGAAVFTSLMGITKYSEIIEYECFFYDSFRKYFKQAIPPPATKGGEECEQNPESYGEDVINSALSYFDECQNLYSSGLIGGQPCYRYDNIEISANGKKSPSLSIIHNPYLHDEMESLNVKLSSNPKFTYYQLSPETFGVLGQPQITALCEHNPGRYVFKRLDMDTTFFSVIYSSRRHGWGAKGLQVMDLTQKKPLQKEEVVVPIGQQKPEEGKLEYEIWQSKIGSKSATSEGVSTLKKDKSVKLLLDEDGRFYVKSVDSTVFFRKKRIIYSLLKYFLQSKGSSYIEDVFRELWRIKHKGNSFPTHKDVTKKNKKDTERTIRHLNSMLDKLGVGENIIVTQGERFTIPSDIKMVWIERKTSELESQ